MSPEETIVGKLQTIEKEDIEVCSISWTKGDNDTTNSPVELPTMPPESSFQPEYNNTGDPRMLKYHRKPKMAYLHYLRGTTIALLFNHLWM